MTTYGVTSTGFVRKTLEAIRQSLADKIHERISPRLRILKEDGTPERSDVGNVVNIFSDELSQAWEVAEHAYYGADPDNGGDDAFEGICALTGVRRNGPTRGTVNTVCTFSAGFSCAPGVLVAIPDGFPSDRWTNRSAVPTQDGAPASLVFQSEKTGPNQFAAAGSLIIGQPTQGWLSITNAEDSERGFDQESIPALRIRRENSLAIQGGSALAGIVADVAAVANVQAVAGRENTDSFRHGKLPPHSFQIVVYDGETEDATNAAIATAIRGSKPPGIETVGSTSYQAEGWDLPINFDRANVLQVWVVGNVSGDFDVDALKAKLLALYEPEFDTTIVLERLRAECFTVEGVTDVPSFEIGLSEGGVGSANITPLFGQIAILSSVRILINEGA